MSFPGLLIHRCIIQRIVAGAVDGFGQVTESFVNHLTDVPCRYHPFKQGREVDTVHKKTVVSHHQMFVHDIDVVEADRIVSITEGATTLDDGPFDIVRVNRRADSVSGHHLELWLKRVAGSSYHG